MEVRLANSELILRRCIFIRLAELTIEKFQSLVNNGAGAIVILLPFEFQTSATTNREVSNALYLNCPVCRCLYCCYGLPVSQARIPF